MKENMKIVLVTGGFDPLHSGHIKYLEQAKKLGDKLVVGLNSDEWLKRKKGMPFLSLYERTRIMHALSVVDWVITFDDSDNSARDAINKLLEQPDVDVIFANGGDRGEDDIPELSTFEKNDRVKFEFGIGGDDKANSSSWILDQWKTHKTEREWGYWRVLDDKPEFKYKVKELVIYPRASLSNQKHLYRSEQWILLSGEVQIDISDTETITLEKNIPYTIEKEVWHRAFNPGSDAAYVLEIQNGICEEDDIERKESDKSDPEPERYYDWMLWKLRQTRRKNAS